jgi:YVTN family beta-propeller protein
MKTRLFPTLATTLICALCGGALAESPGEVEQTPLPTGQFITPLAAPGASFEALNPHLHDFPDYTAGQAMSEALSPDGRTLLILTTGYNVLHDAAGKRAPRDSNEYVFVYDVSRPRPVQVQVIQVPNTFAGLAFAPDGQHFYVSGGGDDDVHAYENSNGSWGEPMPPIPLGHKDANGLFTGPVAAGLAVTADGQRLVVANYYNDSISIIDLASGKLTGEVDLRPGKSGGKSGMPGGENPFWIAVAGNATAYVGSQRDREVDVVDIGAAPKVTGRIPLKGTPVQMLLDAPQKHLYVASDNSDVVAVIDTATDRETGDIPALAPPGVVSASFDYRGVAPNGLALSADGTRLYVTDGGTNAVAVVALDQPMPQVIGLIPTGWYPQAVVAGRLQPRLYVVNSRSKPGPNPGNPTYRLDPVKAAAGNHYVLKLSKAGFLTLPLPSDAELRTLTQQVMANDGFRTPPTPADRTVMAALHARIKHVIYIIKENRTYDQMLGDLGKGNGDPSLVEFGAATTPNFHAVAGQFVDLDNFYTSGEVSGEGWPWSTAARESDQGAKTVAPAYADRGLQDDTFALNRNIDVALPDAESRLQVDPDTPQDPDLLPGTADVAGMDGPGGRRQQGYLWSAALRAGLSVRNYGMDDDGARYQPDSKGFIPLERDPYAKHLKLAFPAVADLIGITDPYYRGFDAAFPDFYREREWQREFKGFEQDGKLPALSLVRLAGDHMGGFNRALDGVNTPELQQADNDYAVGRLIQAVAESRRYRDNTLIFVIEDDSQDGPDHVDAHRSTAYVVGPYVKHGAVVSGYYTTVNMLRTIEDVLGIDHLSLFDANARPMTEVFDLKQKDWSFAAAPSAYLAKTQLPIAWPAGTHALSPTHGAAWWAARTAGMDFSSEDKLDAVGFNRIVWEGLMTAPYPEQRNGADLRAARIPAAQTPQ